MSFKSVQKKIAGQGHSMESAGAILASASRNASPAAKKKNPKLKKVMGGSTPLSINNPKAKSMTQGRASNLAHKAAVPQHRTANFAMDSAFDKGTADAKPAGRAENKEASLKGSRTHNLSAKNEFTCEM